jgi:hypothetical protein
LNSTYALNRHEKALKIVGIVKSKYLGSDPELFANQAGSGSRSKTQENGIRIRKIYR